MGERKEERESERDMGWVGKVGGVFPFATLKNYKITQIS